MTTKKEAAIKTAHDNRELRGKDTQKTETSYFEQRLSALGITDKENQIKVLGYPDWRTFSEDGKGNIRSGGDAPAGRGLGSVVDNGKDNGRHHHAAHGGNHGQDGLLERRKLTANHFPLDFQAHGKEEDHHQDIVDELLHGHILGEEPVYEPVRRGHVDGELRVQEIVINLFGKGKVGQ